MTMESSERSASIVSNVRPIVKTMLAEIAKEHGTSTSSLVSEWLEEKLTSLDYKLTAPKTDDPALPLEA